MVRIQQSGGIRSFDCWLRLSVVLTTIVSTKCVDLNDAQHQDIDGLTCLSRGIHLTPANFQAETCALCYIYMPPTQFKLKWTKTLVANVATEDILSSSGFIPDSTISVLTNGNATVVANHTDSTSPLLESFSGESSVNLWFDCCEAAIRCCQIMRFNQMKKASLDNFDKVQRDTSAIVEESSPSRCPPTWDGWQCWQNGGAPGVTETATCPKYIYFHTHGQLMQNTCEKNAEKLCLPSGQWYVKPVIMSEWTNYTTCIKVNNLVVQEHAHIAMYGISVTALLPAIVIFFSYKTLRVPRIAIHKNMFGSLLLHCVFMITFKGIVLLPFIENPQANTILEENTSGCQVLLILTKYFRLTNYTWMFCEGYYLHRLLANTFEEERSLAFILTIGWGVPMLPCIVYAFLRLIFDNSKCWTLPVDDENGWVEWIYMAPGLICILANFIFFINIFRILVTKLQAPHANEPAHFRKAVRATVVLLPLFGLHWLLTLYRPQSGDCILTTIYKYVNVMLDGLQGLMVAIAFCYRNGEIQNLLRASWKRILERYYPKGRTTNIQLSEFPRGGSETCITQVPQHKVTIHHRNHKDNEDDQLSRSLLAPTKCQKQMKTVIVLEAQGALSSGAPSPSTKSINSTVSNNSH